MSFTGKTKQILLKYFLPDALIMLGKYHDNSLHLFKTTRVNFKLFPGPKQKPMNHYTTLKTKKSYERH
jgi:hypothetical protein